MGYSITSIIIYRAYITTPIPFFSKKHTKPTGFYGQNSNILIPPQIAVSEIKIFFETEKSAKLVSYIVILLVQQVEGVKFSSEVVGTNWVPKTEFS